MKAPPSSAFAREFGRDGISVNLVAPGVGVTSAVKGSFPPQVAGRQIQRRAVNREEKEAAGAPPDARFAATWWGLP